MSKNKNHIESLTPELIEQYLEGTLSHAQMHEVERLMLESDFDSEAMEGFESVGSAGINQDLSTLRDRIEKRVDESRTKNTWPFYLKIAASLLLLMASTYLIINWFDFTSQEGTQITKIETTDEPTDEQDIEADQIEEAVDKAPETASKSTSPVIQKEEQPQSDIVTAIPEEDELLSEQAAPAEKSNISDTAAGQGLLATLPDTEPVVAPPTELEDPVVSEKQIEMMELADAVAEDHQEAIPEEPVSVQSKRALRAKSKGVQPTAAPRAHEVIEVKGKVTAVNTNEPLPGVNVVLKGTTIGTITGIDGDYQLEIPADADPELVFAFIGLKTKEVEVGQQSEINVALEEDATQLSEVVVTAKGIERKKSALGYAVSDVEEKTITSAQPVIGMDAYEKYLENNMNYPSGEAKKGRVTVKFVVSPEGTIQKLEITRSMGEPFDQEAKRLIREGPAWQPAMENDQPVADTVKIKIKFKPQ
ncbi:MAG: TonB family protein [Fulvivirga sp.]|nr:TonB family protein [Fulvivirga sp.]